MEIANDKEKKFCDLMERNVKVLKNNSNYFINQLNIHSIKVYINNLKKKNYNEEKIFLEIMEMNE